MYTCIGWTQMQQATQPGVGTEQGSSERTSSVINKQTILQNSIYFLKGHSIVCHIFTISSRLLSDNAPAHHRYYLIII